jgi:prepilin-type N-terminal cleavage/methylation domain-containing protein
LEDRKEQGFTLIELLIAIVVVGILAAVAIVGIAGLTNTGNKSACVQSEDAARAASAAFYANQSPNAWPTSFTDLTTAVAPASPVMELSPGVSVAKTNVAGDTLTNGTWKLVGTFSAGATPDFKSAGMGCQ